MNKVFESADAAIADITDGATILVGGFGLCGNPENLIVALHGKSLKNLTIVSNNCGIDQDGLGILMSAGQIATMIGSYVGENKTLEQLFLSKKINLQLIPQGTLAEKLRAGGAGIPAFYTPTGVGTVVADGKEVRTFDGREYLLERSITAPFAFVKAFKGDTLGNLVFRKTARNFNPMIATAARCTIAEVEHLVGPGEIAPDEVHVPGIYVKRIIQGKAYRKPIEQRTVRPRPTN